MLIDFDKLLEDVFNGVLKDYREVIGGVKTLNLTSYIKDNQLNTDIKKYVKDVLISYDVVSKKIIVNDYYNYTSEDIKDVLKDVESILKYNYGG